MDTIDIHAVESKLTDITVTPIPLTASRRDKREREMDHHQQQADIKWKQYEAATKAFNLPPQTQISPVITTTPISLKQQQHQSQQPSPSSSSASAAMARQTQSPVLPDPSLSITNVQSLNMNIPSSISKYAQLLMVIEEMGRDIRPTYSGSRSSAERLKRGIVHARILVRECLMETDKTGRN